MSFTVATIDYRSLPSAMLDLSKQHLRIDFPDDDPIVTRSLRGAISLVERYTGQSIFPVEIDWLPVDPGSTAVSSYQCPHQPVSAFTLSSGRTDISDQYELRGAAVTAPVWLANKAGEVFPADAVARLTVGVSDPAMLPPAIEDGILRIAGTLYEYRETVSATSLDGVPQWANDILVGLWIPRA